MLSTTKEEYEVSVRLPSKQASVAGPLVLPEEVVEVSLEVEALVPVMAVLVLEPVCVVDSIGVVPIEVVEVVVMVRVVEPDVLSWVEVSVDTDVVPGIVGRVVVPISNGGAGLIEPPAYREEMNRPTTRSPTATPTMTSLLWRRIPALDAVLIGRLHSLL